MRSLQRGFSRVITRLITSFHVLHSHRGALTAFLGNMPITVDIRSTAKHVLFLGRGKHSVFAANVLSDPLRHLSLSCSLCQTNASRLCPASRLPITGKLQNRATLARSLRILQRNHHVPLRIGAVPIFNDQNRILCYVGTFRSMARHHRARTLHTSCRQRLRRHITRRVTSLTGKRVAGRTLVGTVPSLLVQLNQSNRPLRVCGVSTIR